MTDWKALRDRYDGGGMYALVAGMAAPMRDAWSIGAAFAERLEPAPCRQVVLCGMGGSAIGGDLARAFLGDRLRAPLFVCRDYRAPAWARDGSLVIVSSYSGNTGETLSAYASLSGGDSRFVAVSSGGKLEELCRDGDVPLCRIPGGMPPRAAIGYSLFATLHVLRATGAASFDDEEYEEALRAVEARCQECAIDATGNVAMEIAQAVHGRFPLVYAGPGLLEALARRWAGQLNENAKSLAHFAVYPELNHNEIVGWQTPEALVREAVVLSLEDDDDHQMTRRQTEVGLGIVTPTAHRVIRARAGTGGRLSRMLSLLVLGDFVSVYLAYLNGVDPTPVEKIDYLKRQLGR
jgi:glucose/mannose-6-phosphate isomerase